MVKVALKIIAKTPTWGLFNYTIKLNNKEDTKLLDFL
jgi:hypothetical protein